MRTTNGIVRSRKSKKDRGYNGEMNNEKRTNNDVQNTRQTSKDRTTRISLTQGVTSSAVEG